MATRLLKCSLCGEVVDAPVNGSSKHACPTCGGEMVPPTRARATTAAAASAASGVPRPMPSRRPLAAPRPVTPGEAISSSSASWVPDPDPRSGYGSSGMAPPPAPAYPSAAARPANDWLRSPITYVVAGLVVIGLGIMIAFLIKGSGSSTASSTTTQDGGRTHAPLVIVPQPNPAEAIGTQAAATAEQNASSARTAADVVSRPIDLLALVDVDRDAMDGNWTRRPDGGLDYVGGTRFARIGLPYQPPTEYDLSADFTLTGSAGDDFVLLIFNDQGNFCTWNVNAWKKATAGFNFVNHRQGIDSPTAAPHKKFAPGERHTAMVKVRKDHVEGWLDGRKLTSYPTNGSDLSMNNGWHLDGNKIGIGCFCPVTFFGVELTEVNGHGVAGSLRKK